MGKELKQQPPGRHVMPKILKYPLFFLGLLIIIGGGLGTQMTHMPLVATEVAAIVGFIILVISIVVN